MIGKLIQQRRPRLVIGAREQQRDRTLGAELGGIGGQRGRLSQRAVRAETGISEAVRPEQLGNGPHMAVVDEQHRGVARRGVQPVEVMQGVIDEVGDVRGAGDLEDRAAFGIAIITADIEREHQIDRAQGFEMRAKVFDGKLGQIDYDGFVAARRNRLRHVVDEATQQAVPALTFDKSRSHARPPH